MHSEQPNSRNVNIMNNIFETNTFVRGITRNDTCDNTELHKARSGDIPTLYYQFSR